jgi:hypothetical protein
MEKVTLRLPDHLYKQAVQWAAITRQDLDAALTDALTVAFMPVYSDPELDRPIGSLPDAEILEQSELKMAPAQGNRLSTLLSKQREGELVEDEQRELLALFQLYQRLWLRQSEALAEAVRRGLRSSLHS